MAWIHNARLKCSVTSVREVWIGAKVINDRQDSNGLDLQCASHANCP
jgi:hypothetical protein